MHAASFDALHLDPNPNQLTLNAAKQIVISIRSQEVAVFIESIAAAEDVFHRDHSSGNAQLTLAEIANGGNCGPSLHAAVDATIPEVLDENLADSIDGFSLAFKFVLRSKSIILQSHVKALGSMSDETSFLDWFDVFVLNSSSGCLQTDPGLQPDLWSVAFLQSCGLNSGDQHRSGFVFDADRTSAPRHR
jgi:hypothetical protein